MRVDLRNPRQRVVGGAQLRLYEQRLKRSQPPPLPEVAANPLGLLVGGARVVVVEVVLGRSREVLPQALTFLQHVFVRAHSVLPAVLCAKGETGVI